MEELAVGRQEAIDYIKSMAREQGLSNWKTFYKGDIIASPEQMPDNITLSDIRISPVQDQA